MPVAVTTQEERLLQVYKTFQRLMYKHGKLIKLPPGDPRKTYSWRYLVHFIERVEELDLSDEEVTHVLVAVIEHARRNGLLGRGIALLNRKDLLELVCAKLERDVRSEQEAIDAIWRTHQFLMRQGSDLRASLLHRQRLDAYTNLTRWYQTRQLSLGYLAMSRACRYVLNRLEADERALFPSLQALMRTRWMFLSNRTLMIRLHEILGDDLFEEQ